MEPILIAAVLLAALLHAGWNALVKVAGDRLVVLTAVSMGQGIFGLLLIPFVPVPDPSAWVFILISTAFHYGYVYFLFNAYRFGDLSQIYPLARGTAPILVAIGALVFAGEMLAPIELIGVVVAAAGICALAFVTSSETRISLNGFFFATGTAAMIAAYTVSDGIGVRLSGAPMGFIAWLFVFELPVVAFTWAVRRRQLLVSLSRERWKFTCCALFSIAAYAIVIYVSAYAPLAMVSAIRETSVVMAAMIGVFLLRERPWQQRVGTASIVALGVILLVGHH